MKIDKVRIGVIGLGVGRHHMLRLAEMPEVKIDAICDMDAKRLAGVGDEFGVAARYESYEEMLEKRRLDGVIVAVPNKYHARMTLDALAAGVHVLCEKPMAMNAAEAAQMAAAARRAGKKLMIDMSYRFLDASYALKQQIERGVVGDIYYGRTVWHRRRGFPGFGGWFGKKELSGGGPLIDLGVHRIDLALWLMGFPEPVSVSACTFEHLGRAAAKREKMEYDVEDLATALIRFGNGAVLMAEASWAANIAEQEFMETRLLGTAGGVVHRNLGGGYAFEAMVYTEEDGYLFDKKLHQGENQATGAADHFAKCIAEDREPMATANQGVLLMRILDAVYESARQGREVPIAGADR